MFKLSINFFKVIRENVPQMLSTPIRLSIIKALTLPFRMMYTEFVAKKKELFYKASYNGSSIYLQNALNDKFDPTDRGITLEDAFYDQTHLFLKSELQPDLIAYRKWNATDNFVTGAFCFKDGVIYESNSTPNINNVPGVDPEWDPTPEEITYLRMKSNFRGSMNFTVIVPPTVVFSETEMKALIKYYIPAGFGFSIRIS